MMGARLVGEAIAYNVDVPLQPNEYSLLISMALTALDGGGDDGREPRRYYDSREAMCLAIGRRVVDSRNTTATAAERAARASALEFVRRALKGLLALGAITQVRSGRVGQRAEFILDLDVTRTRSTDEFRLRRRRLDAKRERARHNLSASTQPNDGAGTQPNDGAGTQPNDGAGTQPNDGAGAKEPLRNHRGRTRGNTSPHSTTSLELVDKSKRSDEAA